MQTHPSSFRLSRLIQVVQVPEHNFMIKVMGSNFNGCISQKNYMLEQPLLVDKRCRMCELDSGGTQMIRKAKYMGLCKQHFWRLCGRGSEVWQQTMMHPKILAMKPEQAFEARMAKLTAVYEKKAKSLARNVALEIARRKQDAEEKVDAEAEEDVVADSTEEKIADASDGGKESNADANEDAAQTDRDNEQARTAAKLLPNVSDAGGGEEAMHESDGEENAEAEDDAGIQIRTDDTQLPELDESDQSMAVGAVPFEAAVDEYNGDGTADNMLTDVADEEGAPLLGRDCKQN